MHAGVLSATRGQRWCTAKVLMVGVCPCAAANDVVTLHSIRGLATLIFQHCPLFYYKVIALK
jgi:hypothetical protein